MNKKWERGAVEEEEDGTARISRSHHLCSLAAGTGLTVGLHVSSSVRLRAIPRPNLLLPGAPPLSVRRRSRHPIRRAGRLFENKRLSVLRIVV